MPHKSVAERLFQAIFLEVLAVALCTPLFAWIMSAPVERMGALAIANSAVSALWITLFNAGTDRLRLRLGVRPGFAWRSVHAVAYEATLVLFTLPLAMWWLGIGLGAAVMLDIGLVLFFIPYTYAYHWAYDAAREAVVRRTSASDAGTGWR